MATKAAKSITINATKYELANTLAMNADKIQLLAKDVVLGEVEIPSGGSGEALFFTPVRGEEPDTWIAEVKNGKGETISDKADAYAIIEKGGMVYAVVHSYYDHYDPAFQSDNDAYIPMSASFGNASDFYVTFDTRGDFLLPASYNTQPQIKVDWHDSTPTWIECTPRGLFYISKTGMTSLSGLAVGDAVSYYGRSDHITSFYLLTSGELEIYFGGISSSTQSNCISTMINEYGMGTTGVTFLASFNSEKYLIGLKCVNSSGFWTIGSLKAL